MDVKRSRIDIEIDDLTCAICLSVPCGEIVQCSIGRHFFCKDCGSNLPKSCPTCRTKGAFTRSMFAEQCVRQLPWKCPDCEEDLLREGKAVHEDSCMRKPFQCPKCSDKTCHAEFETHVKAKHSEAIVKLGSLPSHILNPNLKWTERHFLDVPLLQLGIVVDNYGGVHSGDSVLVAFLGARTTSDGIFMIKILPISSITTPIELTITASAVTSSTSVTCSLHNIKIPSSEIWSETRGTEIALTSVASIHSLLDKVDRIELRFNR